MENEVSVNSLTERPLMRVKDVFTYKSMGFTKYVERYSNYVKLSIISNIDSELVYTNEFVDVIQASYLNDDVFLELDQYVRIHMDEIDKVFYQVSNWSV